MECVLRDQWTECPRSVLPYEAIHTAEKSSLVFGKCPFIFLFKRKMALLFTPLHFTSLHIQVKKLRNGYQWSINVRWIQFAVKNMASGYFVCVIGRAKSSQSLTRRLARWRNRPGKRIFDIWVFNMDFSWKTFSKYYHYHLVNVAKVWK